MPPKRTKSAISSNKTGSQWENILSTALFCEKDVWTANVVILNSNSSKEVPIVQCLNEAIGAGNRKLFAAINKNHLYSQINVKAGGKAAKGKEIKIETSSLNNQYGELFDKCRPYLESTSSQDVNGAAGAGGAGVGELPVSLQALLVKSQLMSIKQKDMTRRELALRPDTGRMSKPTSATDKKGKGKDRVKSATKKGKAAQETQKATKLKKRGEDDDDIQFIDDEPKDGAQHYIIISGFHASARLLSALADINVVVDSVLRCHDDRSPVVDSPVSDSGQLAAELHEEMLQNERQLTNYWASLPNILKLDSRLININLSTFKAHLMANDLSPEQITKYTQRLYDNFANEIYKLQKCRRQWLHFLDNLKLIKIPTIGSEETAAKNYNDSRKYKELISSVPMQSASVPLIMDCMLEQVVFNAEKSRERASTTPSISEESLDPLIAKGLFEMTSKLGLNAEERKVLANDFQLKEEPLVKEGGPVLINFNDDINHRLHDTKPTQDFNPILAENTMLKSLPAYYLIKSNQKQVDRRVQRQRAAAFNELQSYMNVSAKLSKAELEHAFTQFCFECKSLESSCGDSNDSNPWDFPYAFYDKMKSLKQMQTCSKPIGDNNRSETEQSVWPSGVDDLISLAESARSNGKSLDRPQSSPANGSYSSRSKTTPDTIKTTTDQSKTSEKKYGEINNQQKRCLDEWCFTEKLNSENLQQIINQSLLLLPIANVYQRKNDSNLLITLHNPHNSQTMSNEQSCFTYIHSDIGYRNYDENVSTLLTDWTCEQEAKYQLELLAKEAEKLKLEAEKDARSASTEPTESTRGKKDRSKSPRTRTPKKNPPSRHSSSERSIGSNLIRVGSLKHAAIEAEQKRLEDAEKEAAKLTRSASAKKEKGSPKGKRTSSQISQSIIPTPTDQVDKTPLPRIHWPFTGYDLGDKLVHLEGNTSNLFPCDGSMISIKKNIFVKGRSSLTTSIYKDGHVISLHLLDAETINESPVVDYSFASFTAKMSDGLTMSYSHPKISRAQQPNNMATTIATTIIGDQSDIATTFRADMPSTVTNQDSSQVAKDSKSTVPLPLPVPGTAPTETICTSVNTHREDILQSPTEQFAKFQISSPDGLVVGYLPEQAYGIFSEDSATYVVRQSYPGHCNGEHHCETHRRSNERSRVITSKGSVVKTMVDGTTEILFANGTTSIVEKILAPEVAAPEMKTDSQEVVDKSKKIKKARKSGDKRLNSETPVLDEEDINVTESAPVFIKQWRTTMPNGDVVLSRYEDGKKMDTSSVKMQQSSDPSTNQTLFTREDGVILVTDPCGKTISQHADGTKITTFFKDITSTVISSATTARATPGTTSTSGGLKYQRDQLFNTDKPGGMDAENNCATPETSLGHHDHVDRSLDTTPRCASASAAVDLGQGQSEGQAAPGSPAVVESEVTEKVMFVLVECDGFASCLFNSRNGDCRTQFGNGSMLALSCDGNSTLYHESGGSLRIYDQGNLSYFPKNEDTFQIFTLKTCDPVIFNTKDTDGNSFRVYNDGMTTVERAKEPEIQEIVKYQHHAPRFFIVEPSGSGYELLRYQDIYEYLMVCENDECTAILTDPLTDHPNVTGITILRKMDPIATSEKWFVPRQTEQLIPSGLICRDLKTLPVVEEKKAGPPLGTTLGRGLSIGNIRREPAVVRGACPAGACPKVLEMRQLLQYPVVGEEQRFALTAGLKSYCETVIDRDALDSGMQFPLATNDGDSRMSKNMENVNKDPFIEGDVSAVFERATRPPASSVPSKARASVNNEKSDSRAAQRVLVDEAKQMLNSRSVPSYFDSDVGKAFLRSLNMPDMTSITHDLAHSRDSSINNPTNQIDVNNTFRKSLSSTDSTTATTEISKDNENIPDSTIISPSNDARTRPFNPTPSHASGLGSPMAIRPNNPTPAQASSKQNAHRPSGPTPKESNASIMELPEAKLLYKQDNRELKLPKYLSASRNNPNPNIKFSGVESVVRRKVNTSIMANGGSKIEAMRGFLLLPTQLDFGVLCEGCTYSMRLQLRNTGADSCRFKVIQPPPSTGVKVVYKVGMVAAGMVAELSVEIYAIASGLTSGQPGVGGIEHNLKIINEIETLTVPITATVMTAFDYNSTGGMKLSNSVKLLSSKPQHLLFRPKYKDPAPAAINVK